MTVLVLLTVSQEGAAWNIAELAFLAHASPETCPRKYCKTRHSATTQPPPKHHLCKKHNYFPVTRRAILTCIGVPNVSEFVLSGPCLGCIGLFVAAPCLSLIA